MQTRRCKTTLSPIFTYFAMDRGSSQERSIDMPVPNEANGNVQPNHKLWILFAARANHWAGSCRINRFGIMLVICKI
jgi:hypothetical protein